ncbi:MAG: hypothetical protein ACR2PM_11245 [Hyphomicrobiales bacterium]
MLETLDIERSVWDLEYRRKVKRVLNGHTGAGSDAANDDGGTQRRTEAHATS